MAKFPTEPVIAIDFESSGPLITDLSGRAKVKGDRVLGFGVAVGYRCPSSGGIVIAERLSVGIRPLECLQIPLPTNTSDWHALWRRYRWDENTFDFWSNRENTWKTDGNESSTVATGHLPALAALWTEPEKGSAFDGTHFVVASYPTAAFMLNNLLRGVEEASPTGAYQWVTDCIQFDPALSFMLLAQNNYLPMTHTRRGSYRWNGTHDEESLSRNAKVLSKEEATRRANAEIIPPSIQIVHHPQYDACLILARHLICHGRQ